MPLFNHRPLFTADCDHPRIEIKPERPCTYRVVRRTAFARTAQRYSLTCLICGASSTTRTIITPALTEGE